MYILYAYIFLIHQKIYLNSVFCRGITLNLQHMLKKSQKYEQFERERCIVYTKCIYILNPLVKLSTFSAAQIKQQQEDLSKSIREKVSDCKNDRERVFHCHRVSNSRLYPHTFPTHVICILKLSNGKRKIHCQPLAGQKSIIAYQSRRVSCRVV